MRYFIALFLLSISTFSSGQTELLDAKKLWARDSIRLGTNWIRSISKDTALLTVTDRDIPSAKAVKDFVLNRWNNGLVPWDNVTGKPSLLISGNNLADVSNVATARTNLSVYSITTVNDSLLNHYTKSQSDARFKSIDWFPTVANVTGLPDSLTNLQARIQTKLTKTDADTYYPAIQRMLDSLTAVQARVQTKEPFISPGTSAQYWRGDKTWQTLDKSAVGLSAVPNVDATNPANISQSELYRFVTDTEKSTWNAKQSALGYTPENAANKGVANGYADLDAGGKIPASRIDFGQTGQTFVVASQSAMLAVSGANIGALAIRTDQNKNYRLIAQPASTLANWQVLLSPDAPVQSVNGFTGNVNLLTTHISEGSNYWWTAARSRAAQSLTVSGSSGSATYDNTTGVLNIPTYTLAGLGGQPALSGTGFVKISGTTITYDNSTYLTSYTETDPTIYAWAKATTKPSYSWGEITGTVPTWNQNTTGTAASLSAVLSKTLGGAGDVNGILKANGSGVVSVAVNNSDYTLLNGTGFVRMSGTTPSYLTGTSSQFVKADGSLDGTSYATAASLSGYLPLSGGTLTGALNGTSLSMSGIGTFSQSSAVTTLTVRGDWNAGATNNSQLYLTGFSNTNKQLRLGFETTSNYGYIQAVTSGTGTNNLALNPSGGAVLINTTTTDGTNKLIVNGSTRIDGDVKSDLFVKGSYTSGDFGSPAYQNLIEYGAPTYKSYIQGGNEYNSNTGTFLRFVVNGLAGANTPIYALTLSSTGAATFSSSVTAGGNIRANAEGTYMGIDATVIPRLGFVKVAGAQPFMAFASDPFTIKVSSGTNIEASNSFTTAVTIATSGATTFASTVTTTGFIKSGSSDSHFLLGGGGHVLASTYATAASLSGYVDISNNQYEIGGNKTFLADVVVNGKLTGARILGSTASYTTTATISSTITTAFCSGNSYTLTLPSASGVTGQIMTIISNSNLIGITLSGVEGTTYTLICNSSLILVSNGTTWKIASAYQNSGACS